MAEVKIREGYTYDESTRMLYDSKNRCVGCGTCVHESNKTCTKHDPNRNQAKEGCEDYKHFEDK